MICKRCHSDRVITINGKTSDCFDFQYKDKEYQGYVPTNINISDDSDYIFFAYCLECGQIQGIFPVNDPDVQYYDHCNEIEDEA